MLIVGHTNSKGQVPTIDIWLVNERVVKLKFVLTDLN